MEDEDSMYNLEYWFDENGNVAALFSTPTSEFEMRYSKWSKYEKMKQENPHLYAQIFSKQ